MTTPTRTPGTASNPTPPLASGAGRPGNDRRWPTGPSMARRRAGDRIRLLLAPVWQRRGYRFSAAVAVAAAWALLAGWWTPRGPLTTGEALTTMAVSVAVGTTAGLALRSRWAQLVTPITFAAVFEFVRRSTAGPTVDGLHLSEYGVIAFVVGRGLHALLALVPMMLGASLGAALARRLRAERIQGSGWHRLGSHSRRAVAGLTALALLALAAGLARPAGTDVITGSDGKRLAGSVAELTRVKIGGHDLSMMIRGQSTANPVLLFLAGGPGGSELGAMRNHGRALEKDFVVVTWDQRGTGKSYPQLDPASTLTLENAVHDAVEVTNYLRNRFHQDKIYLLGQSWGTVLGVLAVQRQPDLYRAYIGTGQMVSPRATDLVFYRDTLAWAKRTGNSGLVKTLTENGPPPYRQAINYEAAVSHETEVYPYDHSGNAEGVGQMSEGIFAREYALIDQVHALAGVMDTFALLYPQIQHIDFRTQASRLDVPVYLFQGRHEAPGRAQFANQWFQMLDAPRKAMAVAETSGHRPLFEQPAAFHRFMTDTVLRQTNPGR